MVKKITYWTAVGQFFEMVERQLNSTHDLQIRSCPIVKVPIEMRKTTSCPMIAFSTSDSQLDEAALHMISFLDSVFPAITEVNTLDEVPSILTDRSDVSTGQPSIFEKMDGLFVETSEKESNIVPQLPVFAKSPVDSLRLYNKLPILTSTSDVSGLSDSLLSSDITSLVPLNRMDVVLKRETRLREQMELQTKIIEKQNEIITAFAELAALSKKISNA